MNKKKAMALCLSFMLASSAIFGMTGCQKKEAVNSDGTISISVGNWPYETDTAELARMEQFKQSMSEQYPNVTVMPDTYHYDTKTFTMKASANQLPTLYAAYFTEFKKIVKAGYAADITDVMEKRGLTTAINPELLNMVTDDNGRIRAVPANAYAQGLCINKELFRQAGLVNADGSAKIPDTYEQMAEYAQIIKEKTGKAGFVMPTTNNVGGWHFMNIAWSNGVEFMKQTADGGWTATFNTPEAVKSLQYIKDLKWKYNALPDNSVIDLDELKKLFGTGQAGMVFMPDSGEATKEYGLSVKTVAMARMPAGDVDRYTQMGGGLWLFAPNATQDQINASLQWLEVTGFKPLLDESAKKTMVQGLQLKQSQNYVILGKSTLPVWVDENRAKESEEISAPYVNVDVNDFKSYLDFDGVKLHSEEPMDCQELYAVLDGCIQEVITNKNADPAALIAQACADFQKNHLDKD